VPPLFIVHSFAIFSTPFRPLPSTFFFFWYGEAFQASSFPFFPFQLRQLTDFGYWEEGSRVCLCLFFPWVFSPPPMCTPPPGNLRPQGAMPYAMPAVSVLPFCVSFSLYAPALESRYSGRLNMESPPPAPSQARLHPFADPRRSPLNHTYSRNHCDGNEAHSPCLLPTTCLETTRRIGLSMLWTSARIFLSSSSNPLKFQFFLGPIRGVVCGGPLPPFVPPQILSSKPDVILSNW